MITDTELEQVVSFYDDFNDCVLCYGLRFDGPALAVIDGETSYGMRFDDSFGVVRINLLIRDGKNVEHLSVYKVDGKLLYDLKMNAVDIVSGWEIKEDRHDFGDVLLESFKVLHDDMMIRYPEYW